jgi:hypothetical protein
MIQLGTPQNTTQLPFTSEGKSKIEAFRSLLGPQEDRPGNYCLGSGMPESMLFSGITGQYPMEIVQTPDLILVLYESHTEVRHFYLYSKIIPEEDRLPARNGYSTAHWESDTLVVETDALKEQVDQAYPHSEAARIVERYRLTTERGSHHEHLVTNRSGLLHEAVGGEEGSPSPWHFAAIRLYRTVLGKPPRYAAQCKGKALKSS